VEAHIISNTTIQLLGVTPEFNKILSDYFSVKDPQYEMYADTNWDGYIRKYRKGKLSRAFLNDLIKFCNYHKVPINIIDDRGYDSLDVDKLSLRISDDMVNGIKLEDYQLDAIKSVLNNEVGLIVLPTGAGKTEIMIAITQLLNVNTVIFADMQVVINSIVTRFKLRKIQNVGVFYSGTYQNNKITVCSIHSLLTHKLNKKTNKQLKSYLTRIEHARQLQETVKEAELILIDEADKAVSREWNQLFKNYAPKARFRYGFTATPWEKTKPVQNMQLKENLGTEIYKFTDIRKLEQMGRIVPVKVYMIVLDEDNKNIRSKVRLDIAERELIIENNKLHNIIKGLVYDVINDKVLIILDTMNIMDLGNKLSEILDAPFINGTTPFKTRNEIVKKFENDEIKVLIGSKILKRSLDLKNGAPNLLLLGGGKQATNYLQVIGRAMRVNSKGYSNIYAFFHYGNAYLYRHSKILLKTLHERGYRITVKGQGWSMSGEKFIRSGFRKR